jgi:hypothetical protein
MDIATIYFCVFMLALGTHLLFFAVLNIYERMHKDDKPKGMDVPTEMVGIFDVYTWMDVCEKETSKERDNKLKLVRMCSSYNTQLFLMRNIITDELYDLYLKRIDEDGDLIEGVWNESKAYTKYKNELLELPLTNNQREYIMSGVMHHGWMEYIRAVTVTRMENEFKFLKEW